MRIDSQGPRNIDPATVAAERTATGAPRAADTTSSSSHVPSAELASLLSQVQALPAVRPDVVADVSGRLADGQVVTPASRAQTADALLATTAPSSGSGGLASQLASLVAALQQVPEVRPDAVAEATRKLAAGELTSTAAIARTAAVLLS